MKGEIWVEKDDFRGDLGVFDLVWESATPPTQIWERYLKKTVFFFGTFPYQRLFTDSQIPRRGGTLQAQVGRWWSLSAQVSFRRHSRPFCRLASVRNFSNQVSLNFCPYQLCRRLPSGSKLVKRVEHAEMGVAYVYCMHPPSSCQNVDVEIFLRWTQRMLCLCFLFDTKLPFCLSQAVINLTSTNITN